MGLKLYAMHCGKSDDTHAPLPIQHRADIDPLDPPPAHALTDIRSQAERGVDLGLSWAGLPRRGENSSSERRINRLECSIAWRPPPARVWYRPEVKGFQMRCVVHGSVHNSGVSNSEVLL
ncbi:unnamed protein product [Eretmochelys imbricata]